MLFRKKKKTTSGLPSQKQLKKSLIRPGQKVDLILDTDMDKDSIDTRPSIIQEVDPKGRLILDQTFPRISRAKKGENIEVTFLTKQQVEIDARWMRVGYKTPVLGLLEDFQLGPNLRESVVVVAGPKELKKFTLRLHYRLAPPKDRDLRLYIWPDRTKVTLSDVSSSGVKFMHPRIWTFSVGHPISLALVSGGQTLVLEGRVVRSGEVRSGAGKGNGVTAVNFSFTSQESQRKLSALLQDMVRHKLAKRSGLLDKGKK